MDREDIIKIELPYEANFETPTAIVKPARSLPNGRRAYEIVEVNEAFQRLRPERETLIESPEMIISKVE